MTSKLILRFLRTAALTCAFLLGNTSLAQERFLPIQVNDQVCNPMGIKSPNVKSCFSFQQFDQAQMRERALKVATKAEGDMYNLTLKLEYDPNVFEPTDLAIITDDSEVVGVAFESGQNELWGMVPEGNCNIVFYFLSKGEENRSQFFIIKENVEVTGDMTITLNPADATNHITTKIYGPNGKLLNHGLFHYDEATDTFVEDEPGEVYVTTVTNSLHQKGVGNLVGHSRGLMGGTLDEDMCNYHFDFYVNDVSDKFAFFQTRFEFPEDYSKVYLNWVSTDNLTTSVLENNPNDYVQHVYDFKYTPYGRDHDDGFEIMDIIWHIGEIPGFDGRGYAERKVKQGDNFTHEVWMNVPDVDPVLGETVLVQTRIADYGELEQNQWGVEHFTPTGWTYGTPIQVKNGKKEFVNIGHTMHGNRIDNNNLYTVIKNNTFVGQLLPAPESFTYPVEQALGIFGDNCPINALNVTTSENNGQVRQLNVTSYYVGRYGEVLCCNMGSTLTAKFNGENIDLSTYVPEGLGSYEFTDNNPNVEVDGLPGHVTTTVYFDQNQEDMTPPSIEMLHFRNGDGGVTDRFATAADGTMEFYASDFNYHYYPELWGGVFECQSVVVRVEYAPYGTEDWTELNVEEVPEFYQEPGWGYFYRASLADVTGKATQGWFDLRFKLQDEAGNWQEQVVSPAFRIDDLISTAVEEVDAAADVREVARYSVDGRQLSAPQPGLNIIRMSNGTSRKVWVK